MESGLVRSCDGIRRKLGDRDEIQGSGGAPWAAGFADWVSGPLDALLRGIKITTDHTFFIE
jgi:hypothetical protein